MLKKSMLTITILFILIFSLAVSWAAELTAIKLPPPNLSGGKSLMQSLQARKSSRDFSTKKLPLGILSNLLWAACGINRPDSGKRTSPTAVNWQEIDVYVAMAEGLYLYNAKEHILKPVLNRDIRALTGKQSFVKEAPVNLIYVADLSKINRASIEEKNFYPAVDTGFISQNVYLYCASEGLVTVVREMMDKEALSKAMNLSENKKVMLAQTVGYPE